MTATDQAFIRAYEQPAAASAQEASPHARAGNNAQPNSKLWAPTVHYASPYWESATEDSDRDNATDVGQSHHRIDQQIDEQPDGHTTQTSTLSPATSPTTKPTLSAILASRQQTKNHGTSATSVDSFRLPAICRQLLSNHASAYEQVVSTLLSNIDEGRTVIGVASCQPGTGCTTNLLCLASRLLAQGKSVVLVDADLARPELAEVLGLSPTTTWQDVLHDGAPIAEALVRSSRDGLTVLPSEQKQSGITLNDAILNDTARLQASVTAGALRYEFDVALVDLGVSDQMIGLELAKAMRIDATLMVVDPIRDNPGQQKKAQRLLEQQGCTVLGTIEVGPAKTTV